MFIQQIENTKVQETFVFYNLCKPIVGFLGGSVVKNLPANAGDARDSSSIPGSGRWPGNPLQYSFLESPMDRGAWWAAVHGVSKSQT